MVEHSHRKHGIENPEIRRHIINPHRQHMHRIDTGKMPHRKKLRHTEQRRVNTDYPLRAGPRHPPGVIATATPHIQHQAPPERANLVNQPLPFPVGTPLRVDVNPKNFIGPFAPGVQ